MSRLVWSRLALVALVVAACSPVPVSATGDPHETLGTQPRVAPTPSAEQRLRIGLVIDSGGLNDRSLNAAAVRGLRAAEKERPLQTQLLESHDDTQYIPNITKLADEKYDLIIAVGPLMYDAVTKVASQFPDRKFALVGDDLSERRAKGSPNVASLVFLDEQTGYVLGVLAGEMSRTGVGVTKNSTVCSLAPIPTHYYDRIVGGFQDGVAAANPAARRLHSYVGKVSDPVDFKAGVVRAKQVGLGHIDQGCDILLSAGGPEGTGYLDAARERGKYAMAVYPTTSNLNDQYLAPRERAETTSTVVAIGLRNVEGAVQDVIAQVARGSFGAPFYPMGAYNGGITYAASAAVPATARIAADAALTKMKSGALHPKDYVTQGTVMASPSFGADAKFIGSVSSAVLAPDDVPSYRMQRDDALSLDALAKDKPNRDGYVKLMTDRGFVGAWRRDFNRPSGETVPYVVISSVFVYISDRGAIDEYTADAAQLRGQLNTVEATVPETIGDAAVATISRLTVSGSPADVYQIVYRYGNVTSQIGLLGPAGRVTYADLAPLVKAQLARQRS